MCVSKIAFSTPHICHFEYATALYRPVKSTPKSAQICDKTGKNRPKFCFLSARNYVGLKKVRFCQLISALAMSLLWMLVEVTSGGKEKEHSTYPVGGCPPYREAFQNICNAWSAWLTQWPPDNSLLFVPFSQRVDSKTRLLSGLREIVQYSAHTCFLLEFIYSS